MPAKRVRVALWTYRDSNGKRRLARFGDVVELSDDEVARAEAAGVFDQPEPEPIDEPDDADDGQTEDDGSHDEHVHAAADGDPGDIADGPKGPIPPKTGLKELWVDYAVENGMTREAAEELSKAELVEKFGK